MKHIDRHAQQRLINAQRYIDKKQQDVYLAVDMHKKMKHRFKGIMSYPQRKILYKIGQKNAK